MKCNRIVTGLMVSVIALGVSAMPVARKDIIWVVDGVKLCDSVFDFTLEQMRSDSATLLVCRALTPDYPDEIQNISVIDSVKSTDNGLVECGEVHVTTSFRKPLLLIVSGAPYKSKALVSAGDVLGETDRIHQIIEEEFKDLIDADINFIKIIKNFDSGFHLSRPFPLVVVTTDRPYFRSSDFVGIYHGKSGKLSYELNLNADSTYEFSKIDAVQTHLSRECYNSGKWRVEKGEVILIPDIMPSSSGESDVIIPDRICLKIKTHKRSTKKSLILPSSSWGNKKSVTFNR